MTEFYPTRAIVSLNREQAEAFAELLLMTGREQDKEVADNIIEQLRKRYVYTIQCAECPSSYDIQRIVPLPADQELKGICQRCMEDFK